MTFIAVLLGFLLGFVLRLIELQEDIKQLIGFPGELLMNILKLLTVPLIASSLISGIA